ncbi:hypothetical protein [Martelella mediterranea]|uniref:Uncharacterized protein n=1 Tax=Martelella mediterranea TaxID=293089 RepID=A0A4R3NJY0_9HYPH|nr:hypothetical protein [Martelella mediterranea]TCT34620.1 hypothetical protein EDC90_103314 [Martelella mediterranea]
MSMSTFFDRPAVARPETELTVPQREALKHLSRFRHHRVCRNGGWYLGPRYFKPETISALTRHALIRRAKNRGFGKGYHLEPTLAGQVVLEKLEKSNGRS